MPVYIQSAEAISPQETFLLESLHADPARSNWLTECLAVPETDYFTCLHPEYKQYINPSALRRMSPVIRMGLVASKICLERAGVENPDAILLGSGLGCIRDTSKFLTQVIANSEKLLNPTAFIQSTHNTVSGQIALMLGCKEYNLTFSQNTLSFETALLETMMLIEEKSAENILLGGIDEVVDESFHLMVNSGCVKAQMEKDLLSSKTPGAVAGEGATFFVISSAPSHQSLARVDGLEIINRCEDVSELGRRIADFLFEQGVLSSDIDLFVTGRNGDVRHDTLYDQVEKLFPEAEVVAYKHMVGQYDTSTAFATWLAAKILSEDEVPEITRFSGVKRVSVRRALLFNHNKGQDFSLTLLSRIDT